MVLRSFPYSMISLNSHFTPSCQFNSNTLALIVLFTLDIYDYCCCLMVRCHWLRKTKNLFSNHTKDCGQYAPSGNHYIPSTPSSFFRTSTYPVGKSQSCHYWTRPIPWTRTSSRPVFFCCSRYTTPPSLKNIFKALNADLGCPIPNHGCLLSWASEGVLLLNSVLTVEHGKAHSHAHLGWQQFTDAIISAINQNINRPVVYLLWGAQAIKKSALISNKKHLILQAPHPSPLSAHRGFLTCKHFSKANDWLKKHQTSPICWDIPNIQS